MMAKNYPGHLVLLASVPGGGKGTLTAYLREKYPEIAFAVSCTSRPPRPGEVDGEVYYFLTSEEFERRIDAGDFLEWIQQDGGRYYGTLKSEIIDRITEGEVVVREVEIRGVRAIQSLVPADSLTVIFVTAGSWEEVKHRMLERAPMSEEELAFRKERYEKEILFASEADYVIENRNGELNAAKAQLDSIMQRISSELR